MGLFKDYVSQTRKPEGFLGKMMLSGMNSGHARMADWGFSHLPEENYDLATAFETIYFWPGLEKCFRQVAKVVKPGGYFLICNESDGKDTAGLKFEKIIDGMKCHTAEEIESALKNAGFSEVRSDHPNSKPWSAVIART